MKNMKNIESFSSFSKEESTLENYDHGLSLNALASSFNDVMQDMTMLNKRLAYNQRVRRVGGNNEIVEIANTFEELFEEFQTLHNRFKRYERRHNPYA